MATPLFLHVNQVGGFYIHPTCNIKLGDIVYIRLGRGYADGSQAGKDLLLAMNLGYPSFQVLHEIISRLSCCLIFICYLILCGKAQRPLMSSQRVAPSASQKAISPTIVLTSAAKTSDITHTQDKSRMRGWQPTSQSDHGTPPARKCSPQWAKVIWPLYGAY